MSADIGEHEQAAASPEQGAGLPSSSPAIVELICRLHRQGDSVELLRRLPMLPSPEAFSIPELLRLAAVVSAEHQQGLALALLDEARRGDPDFPPTLSARAQVLSYLGRLDQAEAELERCIALAPAHAHAYWQLARLRTWSPDHNHISRMRRLLGTSGISEQNAVRLGFALHKELDDLDALDESWSVLTQACARKRAMVDYQSARTAALFSARATLPIPPMPTLARIADAWPGVPVFIVGMHRSGTSLLEFLLSRQFDMQPLGECHTLNHQIRKASGLAPATAASLPELVGAMTHQRSEIATGYLNYLAARAPAAGCAIDKLPSNFLNVPIILSALPEARILHMMRDPMETAFSNLRELFAEACPYSYTQRELGEYLVSERALMAGWKDRFADRILEVRYADLVDNTAACLARSAEFCGARAIGNLGPTAGAVATASAAQVRQAVTRPKTPRWTRYHAQLQPLRQIVGDIHPGCNR